MKLSVAIEGPAAVLTIDRPEVKNAIDRELAKAIGETALEVAKDPNVRAIVLAATGDVFVAGGDLKEFTAVGYRGETVSAAHVLAMGEELAKLEQCEVPVIAAVQGDVYGGGCELLLLCDLIVAENDAGFAFAHAKMGLTPAWGALTRLLERVGPGPASRILYTAARFDAPHALRYGLIDEVVPRGQAKPWGVALAAGIAKNPKSSVAALKSAKLLVSLERRKAMLAEERLAFEARWGGPDHLEAMTRFASRSRR